MPVDAVRGREERTFTDKIWGEMPPGKYGWRIATDIPDEVAEHLALKATVVSSLEQFEKIETEEEYNRAISIGQELSEKGEEAITAEVIGWFLKTGKLIRQYEANRMASLQSEHVKKEVIENPSTQTGTQEEPAVIPPVVPEKTADASLQQTEEPKKEAEPLQEATDGKKQRKKA